MVLDVRAYGVIEPRSYYISNNGNIANDGLTPATATTFAGISGLDLSAPCILRFNKGETFNQTYTLANANITISSYGSGANPIFIGSTDISGSTWVNNGDGTWYTVMAQPNWVYINGVRAKISETAWLTITGYPATNQLQINPADVAGYGTITGSKLILKPRDWTTEYLYTVTNYVPASGVITIDQDTIYQTSIVGAQLKLCGKVAYFQSANEWAYEGGKLYIKTTVSPATMNIRASNYNVGITVPDAISGTQITGITFADYYYCGVKVGASNSTVVGNCTVYNSSGYGLVGIKKPNNRTWQNNTIYNCNGGIYDCLANLIYIQNNTIHDIGMGLNIGFAVDPDVNGQTNNRAICIRADYPLNYICVNGDVSYNTCYNIAYLGIGVQGYGVVVHHNIIHDILLLFDDGGAIYSFAPVGYQVTGLVVRNNIVYNGTTNTLTSGIYMDNRTEAPNVHDNVAYKMAWAGININASTEQSTVANNIVVDCLYCLRFVQDNRVTGVANNTGNIVTGNIFAVRRTTQYCHKVNVYDGTVNYNPYSGGGSSNNNYYISPYTKIIASYNSTDMDFPSFQARYGTDASSSARVNWKTYVDPTQAELDVKLYTNETASAVTQPVANGYIDVDGNSVSSVSVPAYGGYLVLLYP